MGIASAQGPPPIPRPDSLFLLPDAEVEVHRLPTLASAMPASVRQLDAPALNRSASSDLAEALNQIPGVWMETRGQGGSRRIQLRSSGLRSPFAVRNLTMLHDGFLLTQADGTSPMEWWVPAVLDGVQVASGPAGAAWGGGYGGVISGQSPSPSGNSYVESRFGAPAAGSFEESRGDQQVSVRLGGQSFSNDRAMGSIAILKQNNDGFRHQEANDRLQFDGHLRWQTREQVAHHVWLGLLSARWELPGSLNESVADTLPTFAPGAPFEARVDRRSGVLGYSRVQDWGKNHHRGIWALLQQSDKHNPFGTSRFYQGNKFEQETNGSFRFQEWWRIHPAARGWQWLFEVSATGQADRLAVQEFDTLATNAGQRYALDLSAFRGWTGASVRGTSPAGWSFEGQLAIEGFLRTLKGIGGEDGQTDLNDAFERLAVLPRLSISRALPGRWGHATLQAATGISDPTAFELLDPVSLLPNRLNPEFAQSVELGWRHAHWTIVGYAMQVNDAIVTVAGPNDAPTTANAGTLTMLGLESTAHWMWIQGKQWAVEQFVGANLPKHRNLLHGDTPLPGTPMVWGNARCVATWTRGLSIDFLATYRGRVPLNDEGTFLADPAWLLDLVMAWSAKERRWSGQMGIRNLTDVRTSNWWQLNAFGDRHHNPAPGRQLWAALRLDISPAR